MAEEIPVTDTFLRWRSGDPTALDDLLPRVYDELRALADAYMRRERAGHTLQPTALVHEAFLRLLRLPPGSVQNRIHFVLPVRIGEVTVVSGVPEAAVREAIESALA